MIPRFTIILLPSLTPLSIGLSIFFRAFVDWLNFNSPSFSISFSQVRSKSDLIRDYPAPRHTGPMHLPGSHLAYPHIPPILIPKS